MAPLNETDFEILRRGVEGTNVRYVWRWVLDGRPVGQNVRKLRDRGFVDFLYFAGGKAAAYPTEAGKAALRDAPT